MKVRHTSDYDITQWIEILCAVTYQYTFHRQELVNAVTNPHIYIFHVNRRIFFYKSFWRTYLTLIQITCYTRRMYDLFSFLFHQYLYYNKFWCQGHVFTINHALTDTETRSRSHWPVCIICKHHKYWYTFFELHLCV